MSGKDYHFMERPSFTSIGHVTHDILKGGIVLGGAVYYSAKTAFKLGASVTMVTSYGRNFMFHDELAPFRVFARVGGDTTTFENIYGKERSQIIRAQAPALHLQSIPEVWRRGKIALFSPVISEIPLHLPDAFNADLRGAAIQGWLRGKDQKGAVFVSAWKEWREVLSTMDVVFLSQEDVAGFPGLLHDFISELPLVLVTKGEKGASVFESGHELHVPAYPARVVDETGAGDVFAAAFMMIYYESGDAGDAARFASAAASLSVEGVGAEAVPERAAILRRLAETGKAHIC